MSNLINDFEEKLINRLAGLTFLSLAFLLVLFLFETHVLLPTQSSLLIVFIILLGVTTAAKLYKLKSKKSVLLLLFFGTLTAPINLKIVFLIFLAALLAMALNSIAKHLHTYVLIIIVGVFLIIASILFAIINSPFFTYNLLGNIVQNTTTTTGSEIFISLALLFCFFAANLIGNGLVKNHWLSNYHFLFNNLKLYAKVSVAIVAMWFLLYYFNFYHLLLNSKIGSVIVIIDTLTINFILVFLLVFLTIWFENFSLGSRINWVFEKLGENWIFFFLILFGLILAFKFLIF